MELILLRHGAVPETYQKRYIGHSDIPIDPALFDAAKIAPLTHQAYTHVYSSDLSRCTQTLERMGIGSFVADPRLREVAFKPSVEGKDFSQLEAMEGFDPRFLESMECWHEFVCEEPLAAFRERVRNFLDGLPRSGEILICTHAGTIREILALLGTNIASQTPGYLEYTNVRVK